MVKIKHKQTGKVEELSRDRWENNNAYKASRNFWEVIEPGDPVVLCELLSSEKVEEIRIMDRDHAIKVIDENSHKYCLKEVSESNLQPVESSQTFKKNHPISDNKALKELIQSTNQAGRKNRKHLFKKLVPASSFKKVPIILSVFVLGFVLGHYDKLLIIGTIEATIWSVIITTGLSVLAFTVGITKYVVEKLHHKK